MLPLLSEMFTYHQPTSEQVGRMQDIRVAARSLAELIQRCGMHAEYRRDALLTLQKVTMIANAGIVLDGSGRRAD